MPMQVMLEQCELSDERQQPLSVILNEAPELPLVLTSDVVLQEAHQVLEYVHILLET